MGWSVSEEKERSDRLCPEIAAADAGQRGGCEGPKTSDAEARRPWEVAGMLAAVVAAAVAASLLKSRRSKVTGPVRRLMMQAAAKPVPCMIAQWYADVASRSGTKRQK